MFGFAPRLPVEKETQKWIDGGFHRLALLLNRNRMLSEVILPTDKYFPERYEKDKAGLETLFQRVCEYMGVKRASVELELIPDHVAELKQALPYWESSGTDAAGFYLPDERKETPTVAIREKYAADPMVAVAVMAHELAHVILLGEGLIDPASKDMEPLTDLATVFLGFGVFTANASFRYEKHQGFRTQGWSVSRTGYMTEEMFGYALARFAYERGEDKPVWSGHLASNIKGHFKRSAKWLVSNNAKAHS